MFSSTAKIFASFSIKLALTVFGLSAQTTALSFVLDASEQNVFWENIQDFKPHPIENQGDTATFFIQKLTSADSFYVSLLSHFREKTYLLVSIDQSPITNPPITNPPAHQSTSPPILSLGPAMRWVSLRPGAGFGDETWLSAAGYKPKTFTEKPLRHEAVLKLEQAVLEQAENNGYPFAMVWLDSVEVQENGSVSAVLQMDRKRFFAFKPLRINGDVKLPKAFLPNYLGIKSGTPYSRARVLRLREQLRSLIFLETTANPTITFAGGPNPAQGFYNSTGTEPGEATINLFLKKKRASRFDFII
ncbi:MAG: hypothetical protein Q7T20_14755, partial [Saprospiraceae bacterium]|nr:hypothetical protein [Saprospiraceae bacterium]